MGDTVTESTQDDSYPTRFLAALASAIVVLTVVALFLWFRNVADFDEEDEVTESTRDDSYSTGFVVALAVAAVVLIIIALSLWFLRSPDADRAKIPTATVTAEAQELTTPTVPPTSVVEGTATLTPVVRRTTTVEPTPSPTPALATTTSEPTETPTVTPGATENTGTIEGQITLQGRNRHAGITLLVNGTPTGTTDASGAFRLTVPAGRYPVRARYPGYVPIEAANVDVGVGETTPLPATLMAAGDTDGDGDIDLYDVVRCAINFGQQVPPADSHVDLNGDGTIDFRELMLAQRNFGSIGPVPWR